MRKIIKIWLLSFFVIISIFSGFVDTSASEEYLRLSVDFSNVNQQIALSFVSSKEINVKIKVTNSTYSTNICFSDSVKTICKPVTSNITGNVNSTISVAELGDGTYGISGLPTNLSFSLRSLKIKIVSGKGYFISNAIEQNNYNFVEQVKLYDPINFSDYSNHGTEDQIAEMKAFTEQLVSGITSNSVKSRMIHDWITNNIYYDFDCYYRGVCLTQNAYTVFKNRIAVCAGYSRLYEFMLRTVGIPALYARGLAGFSSYTNHEELVSGSNTNHAWNMAYFDNRWHIIDTTWNTGLSYEEAIGFYVRYAPNANYYSISSDLLSSDHIFRFTPFPIGNLEVDSITYNSAKLSWPKDPLADGYRMLYKFDFENSATYLIDNVTNPDQTSFVYSLSPNKTYYLGIQTYRMVNGQPQYSEATFKKMTTLEYVKVTSITPEVNVVTLTKLNEKYQLKSKVLPDDATDKTITYQGYDSNIIHVSDLGVITALNYGSTWLTLRSINDFVSASVFVSVVEPVPMFSDVPFDHRANKHIESLAQKGIINGYSDGTFRPNANITRAQAAIMIVRAVGLEYRGKTSSFTDVPSSHSAYEFISAAYDAGILSGYSDGTYRPNANITRAQIAIMVTRAFNLSHSGKEVSFTDVPDGYAPKRFIETLASHGVINGYSDGTFRPNNQTTRAQFSIMIYNALNLVKESK